MRNLIVIKIAVVLAISAMLYSCGGGGTGTDAKDMVTTDTQKDTYTVSDQQTVDTYKADIPKLDLYTPDLSQDGNAKNEYARVTVGEDPNKVVVEFDEMSAQFITSGGTKEGLSVELMETATNRQLTLFYVGVGPEGKGTIYSEQLNATAYLETTYTDENGVEWQSAWTEGNKTYFTSTISESGKQGEPIKATFDADVIKTTDNTTVLKLTNGEFNILRYD